MNFLSPIAEILRNKYIEVVLDDSFADAVASVDVTMERFADSYTFVLDKE